MARGKPLSAAHKAAISAGMKRYWATKSAGGGSSKPQSLHVETGKHISREAAAAIMFGTAGAAKKIKSKSVKKRR